MKHEPEMVGGQRTANVEQIRCGGRSGSALRSGPGVRVELGGDQTGPEKYWACLIAAQLYSDAGTTPKRAP